MEELTLKMGPVMLCLYVVQPRGERLSFRRRRKSGARPIGVRIGPVIPAFIVPRIGPIIGSVILDRKE